MKETFLKYTSRCQAWDDIVEFNNLAKKTFGTQFAPLVDEFKIDGKSDYMYGYTITWWVHPKLQKKITTKRIKNMCKKLEYGHHIIDFLEVEKETAQ
jgi:hypothetical protein